MSDFGRDHETEARIEAIDAGLRAHMIRVYNYMVVGVSLTGVIAWLTFRAAVVTNASGEIAQLTSFGRALFAGSTITFLMLGTLALMMFISFRIQYLYPSLMLFMFYSALLGLTLSALLLVYAGASIARVFFISSASFASLNSYGYTKARPLSAFASFLTMGLFGLIFAMLVNILLKSTELDFVISAIGVLIFAGMTALHTQQIKETYNVSNDPAVMGREAIVGALRLYNFIDLFLFLLRSLGNRR